MICALLVFQRPQLSPWLDWLGTPIDVMITGLEAQDHRRFVKTHTPLDGEMHRLADVLEGVARCPSGSRDDLSTVHRRRTSPAEGP